MGIVSASSEDSRSGLEDDSRELSRFAKVIDDMPVRVSPQDERLMAATATIARLQPTVARFDTLFLQVLPRVFHGARFSESLLLQLRHWVDTMAAKLDVPLLPPTQQPDAWCSSRFVPAF